MVHRYLTSEPRFRERRAKDRGIVNLLMEKYPKLQEIDKQLLIDAVQDYNSMDRYWRLLTSEHVELRGEDYGDKKVYEQKKEMELGYEPGYHELSHLKI